VIWMIVPPHRQDLGATTPMNLPNLVYEPTSL
jgi:hypothetical protein